MGRPTDYSEEIAAVICDRIAEGESLRSICRADDMPDKSTVFRWLAAHDSFRDHYARARETQADAMVDEIIDIADDGHNDWMLKHFGDDSRWVENGEALRRSQLRIDARKWLAVKMLPKKYGERLQTEVTGKDGAPLVAEDDRLTKVLALLMAK